MFNADRGKQIKRVSDILGQLLIGSAFGFLLLVLSSPYRLAHLQTFLDPWDDMQNTDVQLAQALIAFGRSCNVQDACRGNPNDSASPASIRRAD